jgi:hypothetical protein
MLGKLHCVLSKIVNFDETGHNKKIYMTSEMYLHTWNLILLKNKLTKYIFLPKVPFSETPIF